MAENTRDESLKRLIATLSEPPAPAAPPPQARPGFTDAVKEFTSGAITGTGAGIRGVGEAIDAADTRPRTARERLITGDSVRRAGAAVSRFGDRISGSTSEAAQREKAGSTPGGDLLSPSTWTLGEDPTVRGYGLHAANVIGQAVPTMAAALISGGRILPTAASAAASGGGAAAQEESGRIEQMDQAALDALPGYRERLARGMDPAAARADLARETGRSAFVSTAPVSALSAFTEGLPITGSGQQIVARIAGRGRAARALTGGIGGFVGEGLQEAGEQAAQTYGANRSTGEQRSLTADSFQSFLLGGLAGGPIGAAGGLVSPSEAETAAAEPRAAPGPTPEVAPAPPAAGQTAEPAPVGPSDPAPVPEQFQQREPAPPAVSDVQPAFRAGAVTEDGRVEVAPGIAVNPNDGPLSRTVAGGAARGEMDQAPLATLDDGTRFNPESGEIIQQPDQAQQRAAAEPPKREKPTPEQLDQIILGRLQQNPIMDGRASALTARALGVTLAQVSQSKKRVRSFLAAQVEENPQDRSLFENPEQAANPAPTEEGAPREEEQQPQEPVRQEQLGGDRRQQGQEGAAADGAGAAQGGARPVADPDLTKALRRTDRAKGPDGATYMVKQNANGEGYHVTRTEDGSTRQLRSPNPARPWSREQAVNAAAELAVTPKETSNARDGERTAVPPAAGEQDAGGVEAAAPTAGSEVPPANMAIQGREVLAAQQEPEVDLAANAVRDEPTARAEDVSGDQSGDLGRGDVPRAAERPASEAGRAGNEVAGSQSGGGGPVRAVLEGDGQAYRSAAGYGTDRAAVIARVQSGEKLTDADRAVLSQRGYVPVPAAALLYKEITGKSDAAAKRAVQALPTAKGPNGANLRSVFRDVGDVVRAAQEANTKKKPEAAAVKDSLTAQPKEPSGSGDGAPRPGEAPARAPVEPSKNRLVTDEQADAARQRIKERLGRLNTGIDPQLIADGAILAVYHIERGARTFAAYARAVVADLGDGARDYLSAWYEAARRMPGMDTAEMTPTAEVDASQAAGIPELNQQENTREEGQEEGAGQAGEEGQGAAGEGAAARRGDGGRNDSGNAARDDGEAGPGSGRRGAADAVDAAGREAPAQRQAEGQQGDAGTDGPVTAGGGDGAGVRSTVADRGGADALAPAPSDDVRPAQEQRPARGRAADRGGADQGGDGRSGGERDDAVGGVAGGARGLPDSGSGAVREAERTVADAIRDKQISVQQPDGARPKNFVIGPDFPLGAGGAKAKASANLLAISTLKRIEAEQRVATPEEQAVLARYVGWGGIPQAFRHQTRGVTEGWARVVDQLEGILTEEELAAARRSTQDAHYTSREVVTGVYQALERMGFNGGQVLEPSVGTGNFIGLAPAALRGGMRWRAVELDSLTGRIAQQIYPEANILAGRGFQDVALPVNQFDAVIGNPPFGSTTLFDAQNKDLKGFSIHNFFFAKALKALKPGGVLAMVVSHQMLDKAGGKQRRWMADRARFIGAIRLPDTAFKATAGTEVTTDIVFLQKLHEGEPAGDQAWTNVGVVPDPAGGIDIPLNSYFVEHPEMMLGTMTRQGKMRRADQATLTERPGIDLSAALAQAVQNLPENVVEQPVLAVPGEQQPFTDVSADVPVYGHYVAADGTIHQRLPDQFDERQDRVVEVSGRDADRIKGMIDLRDRMKALMRGEMRDAPAAQLTAQRAALNKAYDKFAGKFGYLNSSYNTNLFRDDADAFRLRALEKDYQRLDETDAIARGLTLPKGKKTLEVASKADILQQRVFRAERKPVVKTAGDALGVSLNTYGRVNLAAMADMLGQSQEKLIADLGERLFEDPASGWTTTEDYLSGNVKAKLAAARRAAQENPAYARNVRALEAVQPADIPTADIFVSLGSPWVTTDSYQAFASEVLGLQGVKLTKIEAVQRFAMAGGSGGHSRFGTTRIGVRDLFSKVVNSEPIQLYKTQMVDGKEVRTLDSEATEAANAAAEVMREEFADWIWKDQKRRDQLARIYNDTYNTDQPRQYSGDILTFPGKIDDSIIRLRPSQLNGVWRAIQDGKVLYDHVVGAGKTYTVIAALMKMRQMGLANKPMVAVPNHLVGQWAGDWLRLYPGANILAVTEADFTKDRRKLLFSRIATGDWDGVIIAHSQFTRIKPPVEFEQAYLQEKIAEYDAAAKMADLAGEDRRTIKQIEQQRDQSKERLKSRMEAIKRDEDTAFFDEMGIDYLAVDEAHEFKNLGFATKKRNVSGLGNPQGSQKAEDMFIKTRYLSQLTKGRGLMMATGTPVSNSLAEMYTMQRYLAYDDMRARGVHLFDLWANTFALESREYELDSSGRGLKPKTVLKRFFNVPEMMQLYKRFADTITMEDLKRTYKDREGKAWPVPKITGGKPQNVVVKPSAGLLSYIEDQIIPRMQAVSGELGRRPDPSVDNMLRITNDARLAALDVRLRSPSAGDDPNSKPNQMVRSALAIYERWKADRGTQLIFCDLSTPKSSASAQRAELLELQRLADEGDDAAQAKLDKMSPDDLLATMSEFSVYDDVRAKLIAAGVPAREIAFIHDAKTDLQKKALFSRVNKGDVRILMGSTSKMGAGMNVQERLVALHHLDAPWRPSDLEQREGRIIRQGNSLYHRDPEGFEVSINRYATERTYDARMWQLIERKAAIVEQIRKADPTLREVDDVVGEAANAAEMKAAATGNPLLIEQVETEGRVKRLNSLKRAYSNRLYEAEREIARLEADGGPEGRRERGLERAARGEAILAANPRDPFSIKVGSRTLDTFKEGSQALAVRVVEGIHDLERNGASREIELGTYRGANLVLTRDLGLDQIHVIYDDPMVDDVGQVHRFSDEEGGISPAGLMARINHVIAGMAEWRENTDAKFKRENARLADQRDLAAQPFRQESELREATDRLRDINAELVKAANAPRQAPAATNAPFVINEDMGSHVANLMRSPELRTAHAKAIRAVVAKTARNWPNVKVIVVDDPSQIPMSRNPENADLARMRAYERARGLVRRIPGSDTATVYLVASNLPSLQQAKRTLAHEVIGHFGMEQLLGDQFERVSSDALALVRSDDKYKAIRQRIARYAERGERVMAEEALAMMAEGDYKNGVIARVYAAIRSWLRRFFPEISFDHSEIVQLTVAAARRVEEGITETVTTESTGTRSAFRDDFDLADGQSLSDADPKDVADRLDQSASQRIDRAGVAQVADRIRDKITDWKPSLLGALTLHQLAEVAEPYLPQVKTYDDDVRRMQTRRNQLQTDAFGEVEAWEKWQRKNRAESAVLADVMHDATLAGVDPAEAFQEGAVKLVSGEMIPASAAEKTANELEQLAKTKPDKVREMMLVDVQRLRDAAAAEPARAAAYSGLKNRFDAMPDEAKRIYRAVRDLYAKRSDDMLAAVLGRLEGLDIPEDQRVTAAKRVRAYFESARVTAPYFPLARFGTYWVSAERPGANGEPERVFRMVESRTAQRRLSKAYADQGWKVNVGTKLDTARAIDGASANFMSQIVGLLGENSEVADEIYQLYLRTLPELSVRKQFIHRKGTAGYDNDALRAFASNAFHGSYQLARLEYGRRLEQAMRAMKEQAQDLSRSGADDEAIAASRMYNEMQKRHEWVMNPKDSSLVQKISSANFAFYLGASPAAALVNLTQSWIVTYPYLASKYGWGRALTELGKAMGQSIRTYGDVDKVLTGDELRAMEELSAMGARDKTLVHDLAGIGDADTRDYNPTQRRVMTVVAHLFHKAEVFNREGSGLAAYRMARAAGDSHDAAVRIAADTIYQTHGDYSNANRVRWIQSNTGKVLAAFKQYSQLMTYFLWRNAYQTFKGESPEVKIEAFKKLVGTLGMTAIFSGVMGMPMLSMVFGIANAMNAMFGDDDEPFDAETEFRNFLVDFLGQDFGRVAQVGPVQALTGVGIADRTKLDELWFREPDRELEGKALANYWLEQLAGPVGGMVISQFRAANLASEGHLVRAAETALPKAVRDGIKAMRYAAEGVTDLRGAPVVSDLSPFETTMQLIGWSPAQVSEQYQVNNALKQYEQHIVKRRQALLDAYAAAYRARDTEAIRAVVQKIARFNATNPQVAIAASTIRRSLQSRESYTERAVNGLTLSRRLDQRVREAVTFGEDE